MKTNTVLAIVLIVLGIAAFAYHGITYKTTEKTIDLGPLQVTSEKSNLIPLPPILGGVALAGGIFLLVVGFKKS